MDSIKVNPPRVASSGGLDVPGEAGTYSGTYSEGKPQALPSSSPPRHNRSRPALKRRLDTAGCSVENVPLLWGGTKRQGAPRQDAWFHGDYPPRLSSCQPWLGLEVHGRPSDERLHTAEVAKRRRGGATAPPCFPSLKALQPQMNRYTDYLQTEQWKRIRARVLKRDGRKCRSCGRRASQVHHGDYSARTMSGADLSMLFSLCGTCHLATTFGPTGRRSAQEVRAWALTLIPEERPAHKSRPRKNRTHYCRCGNKRRHNKPRCRRCM